MELNINGTIVSNPTADDIVRALDAKSFPEYWSIAFEGKAGAALKARAQADGNFFLCCGEDAAHRREAEVDAATVKAVYLKFLAGDATWQDECQWRSKPPRPKFVPDLKPLAGRGGDGPPPWAMAVMLGIIGLVGLTFAIEEWSPGTVRDLIPYSDSDYFWVGLIFLPLVALAIVAVLSKLIEQRQAQSWMQTSGRIVRSQVETRRYRFQGEAETLKNVPAVAYEFKVRERTVHGIRIGIGDDAGGANTEATLARYPVDATVTVYYDPSDPTRCVLERSGPQGITVGGCVGALVLFAVFAGTIYWLVTQGPALVEKHFAHSNAKLVVFAGCFGLAVLVFFLGVHRYARKAQSWPTVRGKVIRSAVESYYDNLSGSEGSGCGVTSYRPVVEYAYQVHGQDYRGNQIKVAMQLNGRHGYAEKVVARYPAGREIDVHYDPNDPTTSALENPTAGASWILVPLALFCFAIAVSQLGIFG
jgi:hypothetical protein